MQEPANPRDDAHDNPSAGQSGLGPPAPPRWGKHVRLQGIALLLGAFVVMVLELRYFIAEGTPEATASSYTNLGMLIMMGLPWVAIVAGTMQAASGLHFSAQVAAFDAQSLTRRIVLSVAVVGFSLAVSALAVAIA